MYKLKDWKQGILFIAGIILFFWLIGYYYETKEKGIEKKIENICGVITNSQPNNWALYDACFEKGLEEFGSQESTGD